MINYAARRLLVAVPMLLGAMPPTPSWGNILSEGRQYIKCCPWITTFSGLAIMLAVLAFIIVGDALRDLLDPRLRGE